VQVDRWRDGLTLRASRWIEPMPPQAMAGAVAHVVRDVAGRQHGLFLRPPLSGPVSFLDAALASKPFCVCSVVHSKRLRACVFRKIQQPPEYTKTAAFRVFFLRQPGEAGEITLV
jgi:hypothetical protein